MEQQLFIAFITSAALLWLLARSIEIPDTALKTLWLNFRQWPLPLKTAVILCLCLVLLYGGSKPPLPEVPASVPPTPALVVTEPLPLAPPAPVATNQLTESQCSAGFALVSVSSNTAAWSVPTNAALYPRWMRYGVAEDIFWQPATNWGFVIGTNAVEGAHFSSSGLLSFNKPISTSQPHLLTNFTNLSLLSPLHGSFGIVPPIGHFWQAPTPSNSMLFTWESVYAARETNAPISFQTELFANGDFTYRYNFSRLPTNYWHLLTNYTISAQHNGGGEAYRLESATNLPQHLELKWRAFGELDPTLTDNDGDGLTDYEEIFIYGTDPTMPDTDLDGLSDYDEIMLGTNPLLRDTDGDGLVDGSDPNPLSQTDLIDSDNNGLPDAWEEHYFGATGTTDATADPNGDGFNNLVSLLAGINPTNAPLPGFAVANQTLPLGLDAWEIAPAFGLEASHTLTSLLERTITAERTSPWQQFYISSKPDRATGWQLDGIKLNWLIGDEGGEATGIYTDSLHLQTTNTQLSAINFKLEATTSVGMLKLPTPLYLIRWTPQLLIKSAENVHKVTDTNGMLHVAALADRDLPFEIDLPVRPCKAPLSSFELNQFALQPLAGYPVNFNLNHLLAPMPLKGVIQAHQPTKFMLPATGTNLPSKVLLLSPQTVKSSSINQVTGSNNFPLNNRTLRSRWYANSVADGSVEAPGITIDLGVSDAALVCKNDGMEQENYFWDNSGIKLLAAPLATDCTDGVPAEILLCGSNIWDWCENHEPDDGQNDDDDDDDDDDDGGGGGDCECGDCHDEDAELGSLRFRIPLGSEGRDRLSGYIWFEMEMPTTVTAELLRILADDTVIATTNSGVIKVQCTAQRGNTIEIQESGNTISLAVCNHQNELQHVWQITSHPNGNIQVVKSDAAENLLSDEIYSCSYGIWQRYDNLTTLIEKHHKYEENGYRHEYTESILDGQELSHSYKTTKNYGTVTNPLWLTQSQYLSQGNYTSWSVEYAYYKDSPGNKRSGKLKMRYDNRAYDWCFYNYDTRGRTTIKAEPLDGAPPPMILFNSPHEPTTASELAALPTLSSKVTTYDYKPLVKKGDSNDLQDSRKAREVSEWIVVEGEARLTARTWYVYIRSYTNGFPTLTTRTIKAASSAAEFSDAANAISTTTHYSGAEDYDALPELWNLPLREEEPDGTLRTWEYELGEWQNQTFTSNPFGKHLRITQRTGTTALPYGLPNISTYTVKVRNNFGDTLLHETHLYTGSQNASLLNHKISRYDAQGHLLTTHYADGTALSNIWDCCRLQERRERSGATTHFIEYPWAPLWSAEVQISHANLPVANGYYPATEYLRDGAGRVTNTVESLWHNGQPAANQPTLQSFTLYPHVSDDYSIHYNPLGVATTNKTTILNGAEIREESIAGVTHTTTRYKNGSTIRETKWDGKWRRETQEEKYNALGERLELQITEASDAPIVTNSITHYDFLGRAHATTTPLGTTSNFYDGASTRLTRSTRTGSPDTLYLYDALGTLTTTILDIDQDGAPSYVGPDRITATTTYHEADLSNNWWQVTFSTRHADGVTNLTSIVRERLTGLSTELLNHTVTVDANSFTTTVVRLAESGSDTITGVTQIGTATPTVRCTLYGYELESTDLNSTLLSTYDGFARLASQTVTNEVTTLSQSTLTYHNFGNVVTNLTTHGALEAITTTGYDGQGRAVSQTDALGNIVETTYDSLGQTLTLSGATYPVCYAYDTAGHQIELGTTRDGITYDKTYWLYDPVTGLPTKKTYADNSQIYYNYTTLGQPLRTTWARGTWKENVYDALGQMAGITYSDNTPNLTFARNSTGSVTNVNNAVGLTNRYVVNDRQAVTNEILQLDSYVFTTERALDSHNRPTMTTLHLTNELHISKSYAYDDENRLAQLMFTNSLGRSCTATYCYAGSHETNMAVTLSNGNTFIRSHTRDPHRPTLVTRHDYAFNGTLFTWYSCNHDALGRVTNAYDSLSVVSAFLYNTRSEVINAVVGTNTTAYLYNSIGSRILSSKNNESTAYTANNLNQYTQITAHSVPLREPLYDVDGNLLSDGTCAYTWDAENRLTSAMPINPVEGTKRLLFRYDWKHRLTQLNIESYHSSVWAPHEARTFIWDEWLLSSEIIERADSTKQTFEYFWGNDLSGSEQGAGGVGGLIAVSVDGFYYLPCYDHNGNITAYISESGTLSAQYRYDAFGNTLEQSGSLSDTFRHRFSTKYFIPTLHAYYYGYRLYLPISGCWFNRDPIEEKGGLNLYGFVSNNPMNRIDHFGLTFWNCCDDCSETVIKSTNVRLFPASYAQNYVNAQDKSQALLNVLGVGSDAITMLDLAGSITSLNNILLSVAKNIINTTITSKTSSMTQDAIQHLQKKLDSAHGDASGYLAIITVKYQPCSSNRTCFKLKKYKTYEKEQSVSDVTMEHINVDPAYSNFINGYYLPTELESLKKAVKESMKGIINGIQ